MSLRRTGRRAEALLRSERCAGDFAVHGSAPDIHGSASAARVQLANNPVASARPSFETR